MEIIDDCKFHRLHYMGAWRKQVWCHSCTLAAVYAVLYFPFQYIVLTFGFVARVATFCPEGMWCYKYAIEYWRCIHVEMYFNFWSRKLDVDFFKVKHKGNFVIVVHISTPVCFQVHFGYKKKCQLQILLSLKTVRRNWMQTVPGCIGICSYVIISKVIFCLNYSFQLHGIYSSV